MKRIILALTILCLPSAVFAQCNGIFDPHTLCGNNGATANIPGSFPVSAITGIVGGTAGQIQFNNSGALGGLTDSQVAGRVQPFLQFPPGGRLTLTSGQIFMGPDDVTGSQNLFYGPEVGNQVPIFTSPSWTYYNFTSSSTDQVGLTLALAGSANWAADSIHDVFVVLNGGNPVLATRLWDASMLPSAPALITPSTSAGSPGFITTGSTNAWTRAANAFDGTIVRANATSANLTTVAALPNCLGQDWGAGVSKIISQVIITAPTDGFILGNAGPMDARLYGSNDNTNWLELSVNWFNDSALGNTYTFPINTDSISAQYAYRYHRMCFDAVGAFIGSTLKLAQLQFQNTAAATTRRIQWLNGIPTNDAVMTGRINSTTTISVPQNSGTLLGAFHVDTATAGQITAHFALGPSRTFGLWNYWRPIPLSLRGNSLFTSSAAPAAVFYTLSSQTFTGCNQATTESVQVFQGMARSPVNVVAPRSMVVTATSAAAGFEVAIGVDSTSAYSGTDDSGNLDFTGQLVGLLAKPYVTFPSYAGVHTFTCLERYNGGGGTISSFPLKRSTFIRADFNG